MTKIEYGFISVDKVKPDKEQPRKKKDQEKIEILAKNIKIEGVINAIEIDDTNTIITGEMRWLAAKKAGLQKIPYKRYNIKDKRKRFRRQLMENISTSTMNSIETAKALLFLGQKYGVTIDSERRAKDPTPTQKLAKELGTSHIFVTEHLDILEMAMPIRKEIERGARKGGLPRTITRSIKLIPKAYQQKFVEKIKKEKLSRDQASILAKAIYHSPEKIQILLEENYDKKGIKKMINTVKNIAPTPIDNLKLAKKNYDCIRNNVLVLNHWLTENPLDHLPTFYKKMLKFSLKLLAEHILQWIADEKVEEVNSHKIIEGKIIK